MTGTETGAYAPTLVVTGGAQDGKKIFCPPSVEKVLGSGPSCQVQLEAANVDAEHARIVWEMRGLLLSDLGSRTGTFVNGERVEFEQTLNEGDRICLGPPGSRQSVKLVVRMAADIAMAAGSAGARSQFPSPAERAAAQTIAVDLSELDPPMPEPDASPARPAAEPGLVFEQSDMRFDVEGADDATRTLPSAPAFVEHADAPPADEPLVLVDADPEIEPEPETLAIPAPVFEPDLEAPPLADIGEVPEPPASPAPPPRKPPRPDYTDELPSIVPAVPAERPKAAAPRAAAPAQTAPARKPPVAAPTNKKRASSGLPVPRAALIGIGTLALALGAWALYGFLHQAPPVVTSVTPPKVGPGGTVTLTGSGFAAQPGGNIVRFGEQRAQVASASETRLAVTVPEVDVSQGSRKLQVSVEVRGVRAGGLFLDVVALPKVTALSPEVALPGTEVVAQGRNLGGERVQVTVGGSAAQVLEKAADRVRFRVPDMPLTIGKALPVSLVVAGEKAQAPDLVLGRLPLLIAAEPANAALGARVVLRGRGFAAEPADNLVAFLDRRALVVKAAPHELTVVVPGLRSADAQVPAPVTVTVAGAVSNPVDFGVANVVATTFTPRFFAAPVPDQPGQAFVSTLLGPVLLLGDKGEAASTAERAAVTADALNALADAWSAGRASALQVRDDPRPSVWAAGANAALVGVWPGDVAAYDRRGRAGSGGARRLATFQAALLEDYLGLFLQGQRPSRIAELSSRGKVLLDLYAEAARRARGGVTGVPRNLVLPLPAALEASLRDLALLPEGGRGAGRAAMPAEGVWEGVIEDDAGRRKIQVTLRAENGRLQGEATSRSRALGMSVPLSDISYERGTLKFTLLAGGVPRQFVGTLQGAKVTGKVYVPGRREPVGSFSLDFVQ